MTAIWMPCLEMVTLEYRAPVSIGGPARVILIVRVLNCRSDGGARGMVLRGRGVNV
jgi:hypothetical protein